MTTDRVAIPRSRIPKVIAMCPLCGVGTAVKMASAYADGYHRRHVCKGCGHSFYSLAPYEANWQGRMDVQTSPLPFKDRPLSEYEVARRQQWWQEEVKVATVTMEVTGPSVLQRMAMAIAKKEEDRDNADCWLAAIYDMAKDGLARLDAGLPPSNKSEIDDERRTEVE